MQLSLFWRTFLIVAGLILLGVGAAVFATESLEGNSRATRRASQLASLVNLTRNALVSSQGDKRAELLQQLRVDEGVQVRINEANDRVTAFNTSGLPGNIFEARVKQLLGDKTKLATSLNNESLFWVSFSIDEDDYWLGVETNRIDAAQSNPWLLIGLTVLVALITAALTSRLVNRPLQALANAVKQLTHNRPVDPLPESGPTELATLNKRFNQLSRDLEQLEADRSLALAGISHDIRTPLARLRLELEMAPISDTDRSSMADEIARIDQIVGQFIDYARVQGSAKIELVNVSELLAELLHSLAPFVERQELLVTLQCPEQLLWRTSRLDLQRCVGNLLENARRYGQRNYGALTQAHVTLQAGITLKGLQIVIADDGLGVPESELERLLRPFARMDVERNADGGSGLGLAIVDRLVRKLGGTLTVRTGADSPPRGLVATILLTQRA